MSVKPCECSLTPSSSDWRATRHSHIQPLWHCSTCLSIFSSTSDNLQWTLYILLSLPSLLQRRLEVVLFFIQIIQRAVMLRVLQKNNKMSKKQSSWLNPADISVMFKFLLASSCPNWSTESQYTSLSESLVRWLGADAATLGSNVITKRAKGHTKLKTCSPLWWLVCTVITRVTKRKFTELGAFSSVSTEPLIFSIKPVPGAADVLRVEIQCVLQLWEWSLADYLITWCSDSLSVGESSMTVLDRCRDVLWAETEPYVGISVFLPGLCPLSRGSPSEPSWDLSLFRAALEWLPLVRWVAPLATLPFDSGAFCLLAKVFFFGCDGPDFLSVEKI